METEKPSKFYRVAADEISRMAKNAREKGLYDLAMALTDLSDQLHDLGRLKEAKEK